MNAWYMLECWAKIRHYLFLPRTNRNSANTISFYFSADSFRGNRELWILTIPQILFSYIGFALKHFLFLFVRYRAQIECNRVALQRCCILFRTFIALISSKLLEGTTTRKRIRFRWMWVPFGPNLTQSANNDAYSTKMEVRACLARMNAADNSFKLLPLCFWLSHGSIWTCKVGFFFFFSCVSVPFLNIRTAHSQVRNQFYDPSHQIRKRPGFALRIL